MKYQKEFEACFGVGMLARSQLDLGADGQYFNPVTRERYEWFERGCNASAEQLATLRRVARDVLACRDEDDAPIPSHPNHLHERPGIWDGTENLCEWCAKYELLHELTKLPD